jgi:chemotaxis signal transduction protein
MSDKTLPSTPSSNRRSYVTLTVGCQLFGIPVLDLRDILRAQRVTKGFLTCGAVS